MKDMTIKPVHILIKLVYQVQGNIEMVGLFRNVHALQENVNYILFDNTGVSYQGLTLGDKQHDR